MQANGTPHVHPVTDDKPLVAIPGSRPGARGHLAPHLRTHSTWETAEWSRETAHWKRAAESKAEERSEEGAAQPASVASPPACSRVERPERLPCTRRRAVAGLFDEVLILD